MTKDTLAIESTDLTEHCESITVDMAAPGTVSQTRLHVVRQVDRDTVYTERIETVNPYPAPQWATKMLNSIWASVNDSTVCYKHHNLASNEPYQHSYPLDRLYSIIALNDPIKRALRTYPKRMSRAKRKEARAREQRRIKRDNQWWSKR